MLNYGNIFDNDGLDYASYRQMVDGLLAEGKTTGQDDSDAMLHYTKMNVQRMNRVDKTTVLSDKMCQTIDAIKGKYHLLVITEGWCGDAAQIVPVINKMATLAPDKFELKLVLRDQHLELIDANLTNGGRAIPVLLILDENKEALPVRWGPRPDVLQNLLADWKTKSTDMMLLAEQLHGWYAKDKTQTTQEELVRLLENLS